MGKTELKYTNNKITVVWRPALCIHSTHCWKELGGVFDPKRRPWIDLSQAESDRIIQQVKACPSSALSFYYNESQSEDPEVRTEPSRSDLHQLIIECTPNGPLLVQGDVVVKKTDGSQEIKTGTIALCRCGSSSNKPYCDGSHRKVDFHG